MTADLRLVQRRGMDRRVQRVTLVYPERRTGFDRRIADNGWWARLTTGLRERPDLVAVLIISFALLNIADLGLTSIAIDAGAQELNPVMAGLLAIGPGAAWAAKLTLTGLAGIALWRLRRYKRILQTTVGLTVFMAMLIVYEAIGVAALT